MYEWDTIQKIQERHHMTKKQLLYRQLKTFEKKSVFWISFERKHMICHYYVTNKACTIQILTRKKKGFLQNQPGYKIKFGLETILDSQIK